MCSVISDLQADKSRKVAAWAPRIPKAIRVKAKDSGVILRTGDLTTINSPVVMSPRLAPVSPKGRHRFGFIDRLGRGARWCELVFVSPPAVEKVASENLNS